MEGYVCSLYQLMVRLCLFSLSVNGKDISFPFISLSVIFIRVPVAERIFRGVQADSSFNTETSCRCHHVILQGVQATCKPGANLETCNIEKGKYAKNWKYHRGISGPYHKGFVR